MMKLDGPKAAGSIRGPGTGAMGSCNSKAL